MNNYYYYRLTFYDQSGELVCHKSFRKKSEAESELAKAKKAGLLVRLLPY